MKVFLGGVRLPSNWRVELIKKIDVNYYDPTEKETSVHAMKEELEELESSDFALYVISPVMPGFDIIIDVVDASNKTPEKTIFVFLEEDGTQKFSSHQIKSLVATGKMVDKNGGKWMQSLDEVATFLNENGK